MNFYLDFEATQFSERIISIGCVSENGKTFHTLVKPVNGDKVNNYITELTGITNEMLENAPTADQAFNNFFDFVINTNDNTIPSYFCYGSGDKTFIDKTVKYMTDVRAISFAVSVRTMLIDYAQEVKAYLSIKGIPLKKLIALVRHVENVEQIHDAMDDAMMLKECVEGIDSIDKTAIPVTQPKIIVENNRRFMKLPGMLFTKKENEYLKNLRMVQWGCHTKADEITGDATENAWQVKLTHISTGKVKYFSAPWVAAMFFNGYVRSDRSPKEAKALNTTMKEMARNLDNYCGYYCEIELKEG